MKDIVNITLTSAAKINGKLYSAGTTLPVDRDLAAQLPGTVSKADDAGDALTDLQKALKVSEEIIDSLNDALEAGIAERKILEGVNTDLSTQVSGLETQVAILQTKLKAATNAQPPQGGTSEQSQDSGSGKTTAKVVTCKAKD